jgi:hypothetical protein
VDGDSGWLGTADGGEEGELLPVAELRVLAP